MSQQVLVSEGAFDSTVRNAINANFSQLFAAILLSGGQIYYLDPVNGSDSNDGLSPATALATIATAYNKLRSGRNDTVVLLSDGTTASSIRLSSNFTWAGNAKHLIGISSGVNISNRSRIAPTTGIAAFANFFTVSGNGCLFQNLEFFQGFAAGGNNQICVTVTGGRNLFLNCHIAGISDNDGASGADTGARDLLISGTGENQFVDCTIGTDTEARSVANANVELAGGTPRNVFLRCRFVMFATNNGVLGVLVNAAAAIDRFNSFENCLIINSIKSGAGTSITGFAKVVAAAGGLLFFANPYMVGVSSLGADATSKTQIYEIGAANSTSAGIGANPA